MVPLRFELRSQESEPCMLTNYTIGPVAIMPQLCYITYMQYYAYYFHLYSLVQ